MDNCSVSMARWPYHVLVYHIAVEVYVSSRVPVIGRLRHRDPRYRYTVVRVANTSLISVISRVPIVVGAVTYLGWNGGKYSEHCMRVADDKTPTQHRYASVKNQLT